MRRKKRGTGNQRSSIITTTGEPHRRTTNVFGLSAFSYYYRGGAKETLSGTYRTYSNGDITSGNGVCGGGRGGEDVTVETEMAAEQDGLMLRASFTRYQNLTLLRGLAYTHA